TGTGTCKQDGRRDLPPPPTCRLRGKAATISQPSAPRASSACCHPSSRAAGSQSTVCSQAGAPGGARRGGRASPGGRALRRVAVLASAHLCYPSPLRSGRGPRRRAALPLGARRLPAPRLRVPARPPGAGAEEVLGLKGGPHLPGALLVLGVVDQHRL